MRLYLNQMALALPILLTQTLVAAEVPEYFEIENLSINGDGCPQDTVEKNVSSDRLSFSLVFHRYLAEIGHEVSPSEARKACQLNISLKIPKGWRFAIGSFEHRGYMRLDEGVMAEHKTLYYFQASDKVGEFSTGKKGPEEQAFFYQHQVKLQDSIWSACDQKRSLNIKTSMRLANLDSNRYPYASGLIGIDSIEGKFVDQKWGLVWSRCP